MLNNRYQKESMFKVYQLENGIRLVVNKVSGVYSVAIGLFVGAGSANETPEENGISHFIEHTTFKGTTTRSSLDIVKEIERIGADINAYTTRSETCYYVKSTAEHAEKSLEILADMYKNSVYDDEELKKEQGVVIQEIDMYDDVAEDLCLDVVMGAYYGDNGYGQTILGKKKNVKRFSHDEVMAYRNKYYTTDNLVVSICGGIDFDKAYELTNKYLGDIKKSTRHATPAINLQNLSQSLAVNKKINQTHIAFGFDGLSSSDENCLLLNTAVNILGGGASSRLFQTIREKMGLCYSVYAYYTAFKSSGMIAVYAGIEKGKTDDYINAVLAEIDKFKAEKITEEEFLCAKELMKSSLIFSKESVLGQMQYMGKRLLHFGKIDTFKKRLDKVNKITKDAVNGLIDGFFDVNTMSKAIVGDNVKPL